MSHIENIIQQIKLLENRLEDCQDIFATVLIDEKLEILYDKLKDAQRGLQNG